LETPTRVRVVQGLHQDLARIKVHDRAAPVVLSVLDVALAGGETDLLLSPGPADLAPQAGHQSLKIPLGGAQVFEKGPGLPPGPLDMPPERLLRILARRD